MDGMSSILLATAAAYSRLGNGSGGRGPVEHKPTRTFPQMPISDRSALTFSRPTSPFRGIEGARLNLIFAFAAIFEPCI
jgi:hypothetical protein